VDVYQTHDQPPATQVVDMTGKVLAQIAKSDTTKFDQIGLKKVEMFTYMAADGKTTLYGTITFPTYFDPTKKYPALASSTADRIGRDDENFMTPSANADYGFLLLQLGSRSAPGRGKAVLDQSYMKLGVTEMADMAEGVKALWSRPYFDKTRVGIYGTSYGGYSSALSLLKYPDVWAAASHLAGDRVVPLRLGLHRAVHVDSAREQGGYEAGNAMNYAEAADGPAAPLLRHRRQQRASEQLDAADSRLQQAGKSFELQVGPTPDIAA
jgi:dipeptidyl-peptidase-4